MSVDARKERVNQLVKDNFHLVSEAAARVPHPRSKDKISPALMAFLALIKAAERYVDWGLDAPDAGSNARSRPFADFAKGYVEESIDRHMAPLPNP